MVTQPAVKPATEKTVIDIRAIGLSIIAMTHYALSLLGHLLGGMPKELLPLDKQIIIAAATPVTFLAAWLSVRRIRSQFQRADSEADRSTG